MAVELEFVRSTLKSLAISLTLIGFATLLFIRNYLLTLLTVAHVCATILCLLGILVLVIHMRGSLDGWLVRPFSFAHGSINCSTTAHL